MHRIRDVMRRLRLGAPSLTDRGPGLDPNTVAEYLDNTLASDRVTDFEKVCLDSDIHLAEVASCHQILTLVLGEPAEVDPASRQRMYDVQDMSTAGRSRRRRRRRLGGAGDAGRRAVAEPGPRDRRRRRTKAASRSRPCPSISASRVAGRAWLPIAAAVVLAACVIVVVLKVFGQFEPGTPGGDMLVRLGVVAAAPPELAIRKGKEERGEGRGGEEWKGRSVTEPTGNGPRRAARAAKKSGDGADGKVARGTRQDNHCAC